MLFGTSWSHLLQCLRNMWQCSELLDHTFYSVYEICDIVRNFLITPSVLFTKYVTVFRTSWSHLLYCLRNMWQYSELLDQPSVVFTKCVNVRKFLITPSVLCTKYVSIFGTSWSHLLYCFRNMWQYSELLDHTFCIVYEICDSIRNFLITPSVLFSKYVTAFGTSWSHLYCFRNMWQYSMTQRDYKPVTHGSVRRWLLNAEAWFKSHVSPCGIWGGEESSAETGYSVSTSVVSCQYRSSMLYTDLSTTVHTFYQFSASMENILRGEKKHYSTSNM